jgi:diacylglycerol kinase (ATP)
LNATLIYNPAAGPRDEHGQLQAALRYLAQNGWSVTLEATEGRGDATTYARQAVAAGQDVVVVVGGDGSINEAAQALAHSGTALGVLPRGTGNVWAREVGIPLNDLQAAAQAMANGQVHTVDLGMAGDRYFLMWAGIGFDASVVKDLEEAEPAFKRQWGKAAFLIRGATLALGFVGSRLDFRVNGRRIRRRTIMAVLSNGRRYAAYLDLAPNARLDDGLLDLYIFKGRGWLYTLRHFAGLASGLHVHDPEVEYFQVERLGIRGRPSLPVHTDGEPAGQTPMEFRVVPAALHVIVPA